MLLHLFGLQCTRAWLSRLILQLDIPDARMSWQDQLKATLHHAAGAAGWRPRSFRPQGLLKD